MCALPIPGMLLTAYPSRCVGVSVRVAHSKPIWEALITHREGGGTGLSRSGFYKCLLNVRSSANLYFLRAKPESKGLVFPFLLWAVYGAISI